MCAGIDSAVYSILSFVNSASSVSCVGIGVRHRVEGGFAQTSGKRATGVSGILATSTGRVTTVGGVHRAVNFNNVSRRLTVLYALHLGGHSLDLSTLNALLAPPLSGSKIGRQVGQVLGVTRGLWEEALYRLSVFVLARPATYLATETRWGGCLAIPEGRNGQL